MADTVGYSDSISWTFPDWQALTFAVDSTGKRAVLAVQKWLAVVNIESDQGGECKALRKLAKLNKYEIKAAQWCPHVKQQNYLASTSQEKLEVWDIEAERSPLLCSFKAHIRPVTDISWSSSEPDLLATCAVDTFFNVWDIRDTKRPKASFRSTAGASLVQWNRVNGYLLASAHDSELRIWDLRKPSTAMGFITAHTSRIHDIDWSYCDESFLTSCSHDSTIKFWEIGSPNPSPREPVAAIKIGAQPIWRARNYPAGNGVAMVFVPALHAGENRVLLWGRHNSSSPVVALSGHTEPVMELSWRRFREEWQLVSLSRDHSLRIWRLNEQIAQQLGQAPVDPLAAREEALTSTLVPIIHIPEEETSFSDRPPPRQQATPTPSPSPPPPPPPLAHVGSPAAPHHQYSPKLLTLMQEFTLVKSDPPNLELERSDASQRSCTVKVQQGVHLVRLSISFPSHYPYGAAPSFNFDRNGTTIDLTSQQELNQILIETANSYVKSNCPCLEPCLKKLVKSLDGLVSRPQPPPVQPAPDFEKPFGHLDDEHIPFPRVSGASFCGNGMLVCFSSSIDILVASCRSVNMLAVYYARSGGRGPLRSGLMRIGSAGNLQRTATSLSTPNLMDAPFVDVYNISSLLPVDYELAKNYRLNGPDVRSICAWNASVAAQYGRSDVLQAWSLAALVADEALVLSSDPYEEVPWPEHPFARQLIHSLFSHFAQLHDVQTLAMLACVFQMHRFQITTKEQSDKKEKDLLKYLSPVKPYTFFHNGESQMERDETEDMMEEEDRHKKNFHLMDDHLTRRSSEYQRCYANVLYCWDLLNQRAEVLKCQSETSTNIDVSDPFVSICQKCDKSHVVRGPTCREARSFVFLCSICNLSVKGSSNICIACGHGGHIKHMLEWFSKDDQCPAGCGCRCLDLSAWT
eukprot:Em0013g547a